MRKQMAARRLAAFGLVLLLLNAAGCGEDELSSPTAVRLRAVGNLYLDYAIAARERKGPANEKEFRKHLRGLPDFILKQNGMDPDAIDAPIVSERDQEPIVILYGIPITEISATGAPLVAHEKTGKNGKRLIAFASGKVELADEARFQALTSDKP